VENLGAVLAAARKNLGLSQKAIAQRIKKEDGTSISTTYINDIEHGKRNPSEAVLEQLGKVLKIERDYLYHLLGVLPADLKEKKIEKRKVLSAYQVFRRALE
jgi:transcriptional regulator with XRE-family HTH domain